MNIELKPIAESKVRQLGGDVCGVLVRKDGRLAAVDEHGRAQWLQDDGGEYAAYLEGMNSHLKAENEALRWRACVDGECRLATDKPAGKVWLLRKEAEAIEAMIENLPWYQNRVFMKLNDAEDYAQRLRQQADEAERAGGGK